ncbi:MAG: tetratricopeptide repeat protein [Holophaga sp.]|nr:tetratricopeptide repeat protein [Holophaga sp.]
MDHLDSRAAEGVSLAGAGHWVEAAKACAEVVAGGRSDYRIHSLYGSVLMRCGRYEDARDQLGVALLYSPESIEVRNNLAATQLKLGEPCLTEETCRAILAECPDYLPAWANLGLALCHQGRVPEGLEAMQRAIELSPDDPILRDNLLLNLNYIATDGQDLAFVHEALCGDLGRSPKKPLPNTGSRRIRIGYVSNDFKSHSVSFFIAGVIRAHSRSAFEVFCYSTTPAPDRRTENFRELADHFVDLSNCSDVEAAQRVEADQIDILVDLGGHTSGNRLGIFALRPAPVQVSYLGYPATTGCSFIDYRVVDALTDPEENSSFSTERLVRLTPPFLAYLPHSTFPATAQLPALANGYLTFGSFNHSSKISDDTLELWSMVLTKVPDSRLFLKARAFSDAKVCDGYRERFSQRGIDGARLSFSGFTEGTQEHLAAYGKIDIALDTFPYNGTTTTCEALWMGVPVITLVGNLHAARVGYTLLTSVGLGDLAATSAADYVALAATFPEDLNHLANLRRSLQRIVASSALCDPSRLTLELETAYRKMLEDHV